MYTYRLNFYTKNKNFIDVNVSFIDTYAEQYTLTLSILTDGNGNKIYAPRKDGYPLVLTCPITFDEENLRLILAEIETQVRDMKRFVPRYVDVVCENVPYNLLECYELYNENILCSVYPDNCIDNFIDIENRHIKRFEEDKTVIRMEPDQEVFRMCNIRKKDIFPCVNCIRQFDNTYVTFNALDLKYNEHTMLVMGDNFVSLSPHVGYLEFDDNLVVWLVSEHILVRDVYNRDIDFDVVEKHMGKIDTVNLMERFQEVIKDIGFICVAEIPNTSLYSYEFETLVFIGDFPGDVVSTAIHQKYLSYKNYESTN